MVRHERAGSCQIPDDLTNDPSGVNQSIKRALALTPPLLLSYRLGAPVSPGQIDKEPFLCLPHRGLAPQNRSEGTRNKQSSVDSRCPDRPSRSERSRRSSKDSTGLTATLGRTGRWAPSATSCQHCPASKLGGDSGEACPREHMWGSQWTSGAETCRGAARQ